jgi:hypothetical protein
MPAKVYNLYPHWPQQLQGLQPEDRQHCLQYYRWLAEKVTEDANFVIRPITQMGIVNIQHNMTGLKKTRILNMTESIKFIGSSVCGEDLLGDVSLTCYILPERLTAAFIDKVPKVLLEDVSLATTEHMWYNHNSAPPHYL